MMTPSAVFFVVSTTCRDELRDIGGGKGEGSDECEVLAGAWRSPRGSFLRLASNRTDPGK
jgi:hypothetical protein